ncbi:GtrA family protein [Paludibacter sp. 221]|uniref:GtrA family protein n=1 Tax=Paludibacter sp. 221 TaxID=2302939 RepID=UPI0013D31C2E|nr:GtrA family protein [Paludibacter sp. 221]NDV47088.1 GtrA family protein [Paludibacter sp. 221]
MRKLFTKIGEWLRKVIDFFYPPFRRLMSPQLFRYAACGGANMAFDWVLYFVVFHFVLCKQMLDLGFVTLSSHIASLVIVFPITTLSGFLLQKYVTFSASELRGRVQLFRYFLVVSTNLVLNYLGLKLLVDVLHVFPTPSKMIITIITVILSYVFQNKFTFKIQKESH